MVYAHEPFAAKYRFTSALPVQLLKSLLPVILPMFEQCACSRAGGWRPTWHAKAAGCCYALSAMRETLFTPNFFVAPWALSDRKRYSSFTCSAVMRSPADSIAPL